MNQEIAVTQAPNGPLTWGWYLVVFAVMPMLGANMAAAVLGPGAFQTLVGTIVGFSVAGGIVWLWRRIPSLFARLALGALFLVVAAVSALVAQALLESRDDKTAASAPAAQQPEIANPYAKYVDQPIDKEKVAWNQRAIIDPYRTAPELQRVDYDPWAQYAPVCEAGFHVVGKQCFKDCPDGYYAVAANVDECKRKIPPIVKRGFFGGCPAGYTDHPSDPEKCMLPIYAARMMKPK